MRGHGRTDLRWSDVTPKAKWINRRHLIGGLGAAAITGPAAAKIATVPSAFSVTDEPTSLEDITSYNNFYEFGWDKSDPARYAGQLTTDPWSIEIGGLVDKPGSYGIEDILKDVVLEERIYRFRCVEAWSMVVPWVGFELATLLNRVGVQPAAKFVAFETLYRPEEMPGQTGGGIEWPYREGLRIDEAMHPLTILAVGLYGRVLPNQNGAPLRLLVPWKYGFYANVNPDVDHPRWSQKRERRIGGGVFEQRRPTLPFNGYADQVASLYRGMDLRRFY
jgi:sulfoxide reductase catalytic subunit YedY